MKIKDGIELIDPDNLDFWYDITDGGYILPEDVLDNDYDIQSVRLAIQTLRRFENSYIIASSKQHGEDENASDKI